MKRWNDVRGFYSILYWRLIRNTSHQLTFLINSRENGAKGTKYTRQKGSFLKSKSVLPVIKTSRQYRALRKEVAQRPADCNRARKHSTTKELFQTHLYDCLVSWYFLKSEERLEK